MGDVYEGYFVKGNRQGRGIYTWKDDGSYYDGEWDSDRMHGRGVYVKGDGQKFECYY